MIQNSTLRRTLSKIQNLGFLKVFLLSFRGTRILGFAALFFLSSCYSFTGSSLSPETKTIQIKNFPNNTAFNPNLSQEFTVALQNRFLQRTSLKGTNENPDILIEGEISDYQIAPTTISNPVDAGGGRIQAAQNKLMITVKVRYENKIEKEKSFEKSFTDEAIFNSDLDIYAIESQQTKLVYERLINKIFNEIVANW